MLRSQVSRKVVATVVHVARLGLSASGYATTVALRRRAAIQLLVRLLVALQVLVRRKGLATVDFVTVVVLDVVPLVLAFPRVSRAGSKLCRGRLENGRTTNLEGHVDRNG